MRALHSLFVLAPLVLCAPAQAEFLMLSTSDASAPDASASASQPKPKRRTLTARISPAEAALSGFGDHVPLSFAVRQIVPAHFHVAYADAVQQDAPVDWKGGELWRATLANAVRPLGLTVTVSGPKVTIAAAPAR
jgi:hypothetical protein